MELKQISLTFLVLLFAFPDGFRAERCDPKPLIIKHEGQKPCVYLDTRGIKTIGIGYNMENSGASEVFKSIGADYEKFMNGPVTKATVRCDCSSVPCLTEEQILKLLDITLKTAIEDAQKVISTFNSLCCPVQNVIVDMSFNLGGTTFSEFTDFAKLLTRQYWKAAGDDLTVTKYCNDKDTRRRCMKSASVVTKGCGCTGNFPQACGAQSSSCCQSEAQQTCCKGTLTFKRKPFDEQLCCPYPEATCCERNKCCKGPNKVCCPPEEPTYCCPADYPVCKDGKCFSSDRRMTEGEPVASAILADISY